MIIVYTWEYDDYRMGTKDIDFVIETECPNAEYILNKADDLTDAQNFLNDFDDEEEKRWEYDIIAENKYGIPYDEYMEKYNDEDFKSIAKMLFEDEGYTVKFHNFIECNRNRH